MSARRRSIDTVFVANRGEIALRVVRACKEMGIRSVVGYSVPDADTAAVRAADTAVRIGPADGRRSYLYPPALIEAALRSGAQAVHPGYGFLAEDPEFAEICAQNGLIFVGPEPAVMAMLGDKVLARRMMSEIGVPVLPGTAEPVAGDRAVLDEAARIGLPLIIKAAAGGGGRGMQVVTDRDALLPGYRTARVSAREYFGDDRVYLERYWEQVRHVEVQVLADGHGTVLHLGERDCSVQRRHQKLIEETPGPGLPPSVAERLAEYAVRGARAAGYTGAGTFEFLVAGDEIAFIEANCRIQVEHPVTEVATGVDLVREQLLVAAGERLSFGQADVRPRGTAIECRVNAEDPERGFVPSGGRLDEFAPPGGPFVRVDTHGYPGATVTPDYDSLLAKVIVWGPDRDQALNRMERALGEFRIAGAGVRTTIPLLLDVLRDPRFRAGACTTSYLDGRDVVGASPN
ncbi:acetyl-CoA carboxylase biotin carboxylase subunit [Spinactinospora alkalitolerans]|uniref:biotin carboxylase n=1 Tax=Spinactinospora alkalitolerans TaxID=687207 RepID=A0A852TN69_9ACTN|nr:biotin carboxylase N-terminal domain-containing protein [Spinactinospora alkalitolerans]NYE45409.1 acetyl-CoA carboxylase biotin carboxylase subunit [Spinactinospora alkalitolerans]